MADHARSDDPAVQAQLDRFAQLSPGRDILGLERITELLGHLGNPHKHLPPVFHVAGTNGKGSTCAFIRSSIEAAGLTAHVYTSPHLVRFNERIRIAGKLIEDGELAALLAEVLDVAEAHAIGPSFFEATTAAAFVAFSRSPADACIVEVGLGGRLDATNIIARPIVCGIAQLGVDHQAFLGETLREMATEKAGIAKRGVPLVVLAQPAEAIAQIEVAAATIGAPLLIETRDWKIDLSLRPGLPGGHQIRNANLAATMLRTTQFVSDDAIRTGIAQTRWPARLQELAPGPLTALAPAGSTITVDGAHNPAAAEALALELQARPRHLIVGILANKDADNILAALAPHALSLTFINVPHHASADTGALATRWRGRTGGDLGDALSQFLAPANILIVGSLYLAGEALRENRQLPD
ncbi:bifunctional folylpolyglutamate synthase/dihydrofolate synthase [Sphingomonas paeninsulae]|uniref:tetrahydrofolate synthase n=1 Tax=Sphingomonas paeninsulae TaxID=2319844 RepID=A0A494TDI7_SPHPE|nr:bifunctional folylpolyglutamate synthase/dihydrofolate synthase [Sphingomonas paeninsulae]AYJ87589.1 bifunctional folylpolyglutamate synthase/dihydrofolate synthase [Sphingomonas paeninsulae]